MTSSELGEFVARVRRLFGGAMDEELWRLALERIGGLRSKPCEEALSEYALAHGGPRSRFIPAKFFEFYSRRAAEADQIEDRTKRAAVAVERIESADAAAAACAAEWSQVRREVAALDPARRAGIVAQLAEARDRRPPAELERWSQWWLLAVSDIAARRDCCRYYREPCDPVDALEFWGRRAGMPPGIAAEPSGGLDRSEEGRGARTPPASNAAAFRRGGDNEPIEIAPDDIPF